MYAYLSLKLEDSPEPAKVELPVFDEASLQQAKVAYTEKEQVHNRLKMELSDLKREQLEACQTYERNILDAEDATELKAQKTLFKLKQTSEIESKKSEVKLAQSAKEKAQRLYHQRRAECRRHKKDCEKAEKQKEKAQKMFQTKLNKRKGELLTLQNTRKKKIVDEFIMQCKRYLKINVEMNMNEAQRGLFHFKNGCVDLHTGKSEPEEKMILSPSVCHIVTTRLIVCCS